MMRAVGIGQCSWDFLALVEEYPAHDAKCEVLEWAEQGGGPVASACAALAMLGADVRFIGVVGSDREGGLILGSLRDAGVDVSGTMVREGEASQKAFITVERASARRTIYWKRPTGLPLEARELPEGLLDGADMLMLDGLMPDASLSAARLARDSGVPVLLDAGRLREGMTELCSISDHVVGSEEFGRGLGYEDGAGDGPLIEISGRFPGRLTITLGPRGCVTVIDGSVHRVSAYQVEAMDTTGAGDVFHAGYAYGAMSGWEHLRILRFAAVCAGLSCRALGGRAAAPSLSEAMDALRVFEGVRP